MSSALMTAPAEGWYQDPADAGAWRWWDGTSWTDHIRPAQEPPSTQPAATGPVESPVPAGVVIEPVPTHAPVFEDLPAVAQPAPVAEPVSAQTIPQPGEVAPAPVAGPAVGNVSATPGIPVTDQMYWHSAAAEKIEVPRLAHPGTASLSVQRGPLPPSYVRDWNDLGSPNTGGIWMLAFSPLIYQGVGFLLGVLNGISGNVFGQFGMFVPVLILSGLNWIFAYADQRSLRDRGYHPPAIWWMLLLPPLPLGYLIARGRSVRREGMRAWPPELVFVLTLLGSIAFTVILAIGLAVLMGLIR